MQLLQVMVNNWSQICRFAWVGNFSFQDCCIFPRQFTWLALYVSTTV